MLDIREILRRLQLGQGDRAVARDLSLSRKTVTKYRTWAEQRGLLTGPLPDAAQLAAQLSGSGVHHTPPPVPFLAMPYRERIEALRNQGVDVAILERLHEEIGFTGTVRCGVPCPRWSLLTRQKPSSGSKRHPAKRPKSISGGWEEQEGGSS